MILEVALPCNNLNLPIGQVEISPKDNDLPEGICDPLFSLHCQGGKQNTHVGFVFRVFVYTFFVWWFYCFCVLSVSLSLSIILYLFFCLAAHGGC